jgi:pimeloyl-ACP methyl ester carboxylesterase
MHRQIPGSRLSVIPGVGHLSHIEAPDAFNAEVRNFLTSIAAG